MEKLSAVLETFVFAFVCTLLGTIYSIIKLNIIDDKEIKKKPLLIVKVIANILILFVIPLGIYLVVSVFECFDFQRIFRTANYNTLLYSYYVLECALIVIMTIIAYLFIVGLPKTLKKLISEAKEQKNNELKE